MKIKTRKNKRGGMTRVTRIASNIAGRAARTMGFRPKEEAPKKIEISTNEAKQIIQKRFGIENIDDAELKQIMTANPTEQKELYYYTTDPNSAMYSGSAQPSETVNNSALNLPVIKNYNTLSDYQYLMFMVARYMNEYFRGGRRPSTKLSFDVIDVEISGESPQYTYNGADNRDYYYYLVVNPEETSSEKRVKYNIKKLDKQNYPLEKWDI